MAGDWIKIEMETPDKPEVVNMAAQLRLDQDAVTGKLFRIWTWADRNSVSGDGMPITAAFLDRLTNKKGFANAMRAVGWLMGDDGNLTFPGFSRHNGTTAKARAQNNRRVADHRGCNSPSVTNVTVGPLQKALPEKRREDKEDTPLPPRGARAREGDADLVRRVKALTKRWQATPDLSAREARTFRKNRHQLAAFADADWQVLTEFLAAKLHEGAAWFQPRMLEKFLENPGERLGDALDWKGKQRPPLRALPPPPMQSGPASTPLSRAEIAETLALRAK